MKGEAVALLAKCRAHGISLRPGEGGRLKVSPPPERLPGEIVEEIKRHKGEILALLKAEPTQQLKSPAASSPLYEEMVRRLPEDFPLLNARDELIIPFNSEAKYHWWAGGQSIAKTLAELNAPPDVWRRYVAGYTETVQ